MIRASPAHVFNLSFFHPFVHVPSPFARIERARASRLARLVPARASSPHSPTVGRSTRNMTAMETDAEANANAEAKTQTETTTPLDVAHRVRRTDASRARDRRLINE